MQQQSKKTIRATRNATPRQAEGSRTVKTRAGASTAPPEPAPESVGKPIEILLVEDNDYDAQRTMNALKTGKVRNRVCWVEDGVGAMAYLRRQGSYAAAPRPDLILLDWYMPRMHGSAVLEQVKKDQDLKRIPVLIMTGSGEQ